MNKIKSLASASIALAFALGAPLLMGNAANATEASGALSPSEEAQVRDFFTLFSVSASTQDDLIDAWESGEGWESLSSSSIASSVEDTTIGGVEWTVSTFSDGSVLAQGIGGGETASPSTLIDGSGGISARGVNDCGYSTGSYGNFSNCNLYYWVGTVESSFRANFTISASGWDSITTVWAPNFTAIGSCSSSAPNPTIAKGTESATGDAVAGFTASATMCVTSYTTTFPNYLYVGSNRAYHYYT